MKKKLIEQIQLIAIELKDAQVKMAQDVRDGGTLHQSGTDQILSAVHKVHIQLLQIPDKLLRLADDLMTHED